ncbi:DUF3833 domain-containing protein [Thalassolituus sp. LLYu03]|uniref:DUF3833 domain-containing protein n=1 Tax=Thalassolituus sp. LLYu03 TaxID=3421656 RepID=UPI003D2E305A
MMQASFKWQRLALPVVLSGLLAGCAAPDAAQWAWRQPVLNPQTFFNGTLCADGVVRDYAGRQIRQFNAVIEGSWQGDTGTLDEVFYFHDKPGEAPVRETRVWTLTKDGDDFRAKATDVPEETRMTHAGNSIHMAYTLAYGDPGDTIRLSMDDWMYQVAEGVVVNETRMSKFGLPVGQVLLVMRKVDGVGDCR